MPKPPSKREGSHPTRQGLLRPATEQSGSQMPSQGDHIRMLIELLQPTGPDLARRWLAALLLVPREDREGVVLSVEDRITSMYTNANDTASDEADEPRELDVVHPPVQHDGYIEEVRTTYSPSDKPATDRPEHTQPRSPDKTIDQNKGKAGNTAKTRRAGRTGKAG